MTTPAPHPGRIDVHHHVLTPEYVRALGQKGQDRSGGAPLPPWSVEDDLAAMERLGIEAAVLSVSSPGVFFGDAADARALARRCNESLAALVREHPARFASLAILPLPDVDGALEELAHALDTLGHEGVILLASAGDVYLGDPRLDPVMAELDRRGAVALLHPNTPPQGAAEPDLPGFLVEFVFDTTRAVANLIYQGTLERFPGVRWIVSHAGGAAPYLAGRLAMGADLMPALAERAPAGAEAYLRRLHYDTAISGTPQALAALAELVPAGGVLFGSDWPYMAPPLAERFARGVDESPAFGGAAAARDAVNRDNALRLFPGLASRLKG